MIGSRATVKLKNRTNQSATNYTGSFSYHATARFESYTNHNK